MADSDDEYDRKRRDKFRGERTDSYRSERRDDRRGAGGGGREDWADRNPFRGRARPEYREYRGGGAGGGRDRYSPGRDLPPPKRMRPDWGDEARPRYGGHDGYGMYGWGHEHYPMHAGGHPGFGGGGGGHPPMNSHGRGIGDPAANSELQTQPPMLTLKQYLDTQDDTISDSEVLRKYSDYKLDFKRQQLNEFFVAHKDEEWFKNKYHPEEAQKRKEEQLKFLKTRVDVFTELLDEGLITSITVDTNQTDPLLRLLDTVVIKLEGGTEEDLKALDEKPPPPQEYRFEPKFEPKRNDRNDKDQDDDVIITEIKPIKRIDDFNEADWACPAPSKPSTSQAANDDDGDNWDCVDTNPIAKKSVTIDDDGDNWDTFDAPKTVQKSVHDDDNNWDTFDAPKAKKKPVVNDDDWDTFDVAPKKKSTVDDDNWDAPKKRNTAGDNKWDTGSKKKLITVDEDNWDSFEVPTKKPVVKNDDDWDIDEPEPVITRQEQSNRSRSRSTSSRKRSRSESSDSSASSSDSGNKGNYIDNEKLEVKQAQPEEREEEEPEEEEEPVQKIANEIKEVEEEATRPDEVVINEETRKDEPVEEVPSTIAEEPPATEEKEKESIEKEKIDENDAEPEATNEKTAEDENEEVKEIKVDDDEETKTETIDLDKEKDPEPDVPKPRALHRTSSIFLRNLAPAITKAEIEGLCKRYDGFLRVAIADPLVERRWFRRGWVTFKRDVNIKEICWNLNNIRLRDCEMGAIVNRDLSRRVRPVNGLTAHKTIVRSDIKLCAKIALNLDEKFGLWLEERKKETNATNGGQAVTQSFGFKSNNPVLQNITDFLIEEASAEEDELLGLTGNENKDSADGEILERDPQLVAVLDKLILYMRIVHSVDFYNHCEYPYEDEMPNRCGIIHARGPPPQNKVTNTDIQDYVKNFENKMASFLAKSTAIEEDELKNLGTKDPESEVEKFVQANTQELSKDKWLCPLSGKKFKGPEFIRKHIFNKHSEKVDEVRKEVEYFNNYLKDPKRPQLPEHPGNTRRQPVEAIPPQMQYRPGYGGPGYGPPYAAYAPPMIAPPRPRGFGGGARRDMPMDHQRRLVGYHDLDAPQNFDAFD